MITQIFSNRAAGAAGAWSGCFAARKGTAKIMAMSIFNPTGSTIYMQVHDKASEPTTTADTPAAPSVQVPTLNTGNWTFPFGLRLDTGIAVVASSTKDVYTAIADNFQIMAVIDPQQ